VSESEAIIGIRRAAKQREYSERLRRKATEGVSIARIAREARLSRQGVYELLAAAQPS
jgi:DNA invertase Pin-like site-specific DNA recombinase